MQINKHIYLLLLCALIGFTPLLNAQSSGYINLGQTENSGFQGGVFIGMSSYIKGYQPPILTGGVAGSPQFYWKDILGIEQDGSTLTKTDSTGWGNAGAVSVSQMECLENGWIQYKVINLTNTFAFGFSNTNTDAGFTSIEYSAMLSAGNLKVYNYGQLKGDFGLVSINDSVRIERIGDIMFYTKNNIVLYNQQVEPKELLMTDIALYNHGAAVTIITNSSESQKSPVVFRNKGLFVNIISGTSLIIDGRIILESSGQFDNAGSINLKGDWNNNSGTPAFVDTLRPGKEWVEFSGANQTIRGTSSTVFSNVIWSGTGHKIIGDGSPPVFNGNVTIQTAGSGTIVLVNQNNNPNPLPVKGNLTVPIGTSFQNDGTGLSLQYNLTINGAYSGKGALFFNGASSQIISGDSLPAFKKITVNKSGGSILLNAPIKIDSLLTLTKGIIIADTINILTINKTAVILGGSDSSYVSGSIKKIGNTAFVFPLGDRTLNAGAYHPLTITAPKLATDAFTAEYKAAKQPFGDSLQVDSIESVSSYDYWTLRRSTGTSPIVAAVNWDSNSCNVKDIDNLIVAAWNGTEWRSLGNGGVKATLRGTRGTLYGLNPVFDGEVTRVTVGRSPAGPYPYLTRQLDGGYYVVNNGKLCFKYEEEYADLDGLLNYNIYNKQNILVASNTSIYPGPQLQVGYGDNRLTLNISSGWFLQSGPLGSGFYTLEIINEKNEKRYLRFKQETPNVICCPWPVVSRNNLPR